MKHFFNMVKRSNKGQGVMEYIIISSLVGIVCLVAVGQFGRVVNERVKDMKEMITENIELRSR